jgi:capsular polysaccharide biosynthesis protein
VKTLLVGALAASVLVAVAVAVASLWQTPTYEASAKVLLDVQEQDGYGRIHPIPNAPTHDRLRELIQTMAIVIDTHPVAEEAIRRLGLEVSPDELLNNLTIEPAAHTQFVRLSYTDTDPMRAAKVVNTVARVAAERITGTGSESEKLLLNTELTATV